MDFITLGIGTPSSIETFILVGLSPAAAQDLSAANVDLIVMPSRRTRHARDDRATEYSHPLRRTER